MQVWRPATLSKRHSSHSIWFNHGLTIKIQAIEFLILQKQKVKFSIREVSSNCEQKCMKLRIWLHSSDRVTLGIWSVIYFHAERELIKRLLHLRTVCLQYNLQMDLRQVILINTSLISLWIVTFVSSDI